MKAKLIPYEINKEDMLQCDHCGELFKVPTMFDECPNCHTTEFHRIDYSDPVMILEDTSKLPFKSIGYNNRINTSRVVDGIYYVLCSKTYSNISTGEKKYYAMASGHQVTFVELDYAILFTNRHSAWQAFAFSRMIRDANCKIHKVVVIDKHIIEDLGRID